MKAEKEKSKTTGIESRLFKKDLKITQITLKGQVAGKLGNRT